TPAAFKEVTQNLSSDQLSAWSQQASDKYIEFNVPKCTIRERLSIKPALQTLGMKEAFTTGADFSGITPKNNLMISDVIHAAFLEMNETGIEAAAATAVIMMTKSAFIPSEPPVVVRCDKPFYLFIREKSSGLVLFVSVIASLDKQEK
ncbi:MAG: hypothetical protein LLF94_03375, partial [Chlamydiales bacterium]|nr:hypothetical protein [Chlamydiales bacterium]